MGEVRDIRISGISAYIARNRYTVPRYQGPRFGSFVALYGRDDTVALIRRALAGEDLSAG